MEEIKVGEYCRTDTGYIYKMKYFIKEFDYSKTKHSFNIIDLIEPGDYLDGVRVDSVEKDENGHVFYAQNYDLPAFDLKNIKSICTKEEFANIEYKVEE